MPPQTLAERLSELTTLRSHAYRAMQYSALAVGLAAMTAMTDPTLRSEYQSWLAAILWCCLGIFATDLVIKSLASLKSERKSSYFLSAAGTIDLMSVLPIPIALLAGISPGSAWLLASIWLLKLTAVVPGFSILRRVIAREARPLASAFVVFLIVLVMAADLVHILERVSQPEKFGSLPLSIWWAVTTLTTTGYGDAVPITFLGRLIAGGVMICGLGLFGLWAGILATGFASEHRRREFIENWQLVTRVPFLRDLDASAVIELTRTLRRLDLAEGNVVIRRGRPGDCMYFIVGGEVEVKLEPRPIRLGPGTFFGELALLDGGPRMATVVTTAPSTFLVLDVSDFHDFTARHPALAKAVEIEATRRKAMDGALPPIEL